MGVQCAGCDVKLTPGTNVAHCGACCRTFGGVSGFDSHRKDGKCLDPNRMRTKAGGPVFRIDKRGYYVGAQEADFDAIFKKKETDSA